MPGKKQPAATYGWLMIPLLLAAALGRPSPAGAFYQDAAVRAITFTRDRAVESEAALVLLAHQSHYTMLGNGRRRQEEHQIWYVADPQDPACRSIAHPAMLFDNFTERFVLERCRVFRGADTLDVPEQAWLFRPPAGWPPTGHRPWFEAHAQLPELHAGDIVELAYAIDNRWTPTWAPSDWVRASLDNPLGPTLERHILFTHTPVRSATIRVVGSSDRLRRHHGTAERKVELLTFNLPVAVAGGSPAAIFFTSHTSWRVLRHVFERHFLGCVGLGEEVLASQGDSIMRARRNTLERLDGVAAHIHEHCQLIPGTLAEQSFYPRRPDHIYAGGSATHAERALLIAALAGAARIKVDVFLACSHPERFMPDLPTPMQFDRIVLRALYVEEDRSAWLDPAHPGCRELDPTEAAGLLLMGIGPENDGFHRAGARGELIPADIAP